MVKTAATIRRKIGTDQIKIPPTGATFYQALYGRRTTWNFKSAPVPRATIARLLDAATLAPNHRLTEPRVRVSQLNSVHIYERHNLKVSTRRTRYD